MADSVVQTKENNIENRNKDKANSSNVTNVAEDLRSVLKSIKLVLFETQNWSDEKDRSRLAELTKMAYDAEDVLDAYEIKKKSMTIVSRAIRKYIPAREPYELQKLLRQMQDVKSELEKKPKTSATVARARGSQSLKGHRQADDDFVVGIHGDLEMLVQMLTGDEKGKASQEGDPDVLAIVGMGGSGKTTLARFIYNHKNINKHFKYLAWVSLSKQWSPDEVSSEICDKLQNKAKSEKFWNRLWTNRCLIVLDDVWDCVKFRNDLLPKLLWPHQQEGQKSVLNQFAETKIIITSRHHHKPLEDNIRWFFHEVKLFSNETGLELFNKVVSGVNNEDNRVQEFRGLAMEMLNKCGGLPLAIVALGKLLKTKDTIQEWEGVFYQLSNKEGPNDLYLPVNDILVMSYHHLFSYLKPFFLYFGLFPKDFLIKAGPLLKMWMAEEFAVTKDNNDDQTTTNTTGEDTLKSEENTLNAARKNLEILVEQTMVEAVKKNYKGAPKTLRIHDIMRNLCIKEAQGIGFFTLCSSDSDQSTLNKSRRATVNLSKSSTLPLENSNLKSLFVFGQDAVSKHAHRRNQQTILNLEIVCERFTKLKVLNIEGVKVLNGAMPNDIGNLIHLKYLRIRSTNIRELPKSIDKLRMLSTLDYWKVFVDDSGISLPNVLWKLSNLRHLYLPYEISKMEENFRLHPVQNLQTLWGVKAGDWMNNEMQKMSSKLKKLCIQGISSSELMKTIIDSPVIKDNTNLYSLSLDWYGFELKDLETLCSIGSLRKLSLIGNAPDSIKFPFNLGKLELYYTQLKKPESLNALGELQCLKYLKLDKGSYMGKEWIIKGETPLFQQLIELKLSNLPNLEKWEMVEKGMPSLTKLSVNFCTLLNSIPEDLYTRKARGELTMNVEPISPTLRNRLRRVNSTGLADSDVQPKFTFNGFASWSN